MTPLQVNILIVWAVLIGGFFLLKFLALLVGFCGWKNALLALGSIAIIVGFYFGIGYSIVLFIRG
jgi:hypothetical protein